MTLLLDGNIGEAGRAFEKLYQTGMYSSAPDDATLANFFVETGRIGAGKAPVARNFITLYNPDNCEALGVFIFGIQDWQLHRNDDAKAILEAFIKCNPKTPYAWIADYKPIARKILENISNPNRKR